MRHKVFATLIITAIAVLIPKSASALVAVPGSFNSAYKSPFLYASYVNGGQTNLTNLGQTISFPSMGSDLNNGVKVLDFYSDNKFTPVQVPAKSYAVVNLVFKTNNFNYSRVFNLTTNTSGLTVVDYEIDPTILADNWIVNYNWNITHIQVQLFNSADHPVNLSLSGGNEIMIAFLSGQTASTWYLSCSSVSFYSSSNAENEVAEKELEGQDNIENQDTSGTNEGVSDDSYSSLLDIFTGFISAISGVSAGSCSISLDTNVGDLGDVDLCAVDPPSWIQIVGSIIVILLFVPCSMALINRILKTIQEMQQ